MLNPQQARLLDANHHNRQGEPPQLQLPQPQPQRPHKRNHMPRRCRPNKGARAATRISKQPHNWVAERAMLSPQGHHKAQAEDLPEHSSGRDHSRHTGRHHAAPRSGGCEPTSTEQHGRSFRQSAIGRAIAPQKSRARKLRRCRIAPRSEWPAVGVGVAGVVFPSRPPLPRRHRRPASRPWGLTTKHAYNLEGGRRCCGRRASCNRRPGWGGGAIWGTRLRCPPPPAGPRGPRTGPSRERERACLFQQSAAMPSQGAGTM